MRAARKFIAAAFAAIVIIPIVLTIALSFWNGAPSLKPWEELLFNCFVFYDGFWNSILYSVAITGLQLLVAIPCAFGLCMLNTRLSKVFVFVCFILMMMPLQVTILPMYIGLRDMRMLGTRFAIVLPAVFSAFGIVVLYLFMKRIDIEQVEAARLETSSILRIIKHVVIPQIKLAILGEAVYVFVESYNMLEQPMLFLDDDHLQTLAVFMSRMSEFSDDILFPAAVLFMLPILVGCATFRMKSLGGGISKKFSRTIPAVVLALIAILTVFAKDIHYSSLTTVKTISLGIKSFDIDEENVERHYAMPYQFSKYNVYYVVDNETINKEERNCLRQVYIKLGDVENGYCPVLNNDYVGEPIVVRTTGTLSDGQEVVVVQRD